jgi:hypothetical protein
MNPVTGLSLGRIAIGAVALASPPLAGRLFRLDTAANPQLPYLARMFGSREIALGAVTLLASGTTRRNLVAAGIAVDAADAVAGVLAARDGYVSKPTGGFLTAPALAAVAAGVSGLRS